MDSLVFHNVQRRGNQLVIDLPDGELASSYEVVAMPIQNKNRIGLTISHPNPDKDEANRKLDEFFKNVNFGLNGYKFNRDEANER